MSYLYQPKRKATIKRYRAVQNRYIELYKNQRKRSDDVVEQLMEEFGYDDVDTIYRILKTELPCID